MNQVIMEIGNPTGDSCFNCILPINDYDYVTNTFALVKDKKGISLMNTKTFDIKKIADSQFDDHSWKYSMACFKLTTTQNNNNSVIIANNPNKVDEDEEDDIIYDLMYNSVTEEASVRILKL